MLCRAALLLYRYLRNLENRRKLTQIEMEIFYLSNNLQILLH